MVWNLSARYLHPGNRSAMAARKGNETKKRMLNPPCGRLSICIRLRGLNRKRGMNRSTRQYERVLLNF